MVRLLQPASISIACRYGDSNGSPDDGSEPTAANSRDSSPPASAGDPRNVPPTWTDSGTAAPGAAARCRLAHHWSLSCGAQPCHPPTTRAACDHGQERKNWVSDASGRAVNVNDVAIPKFPRRRPGWPTAGPGRARRPPGGSGRPP